MLAIDRFIEKILEKNNPSAVGLDTRLEYIPGFICNKYTKDGGMDFKGAASAVLEFNKTIIDSVYDLVPAVKVQIAYYEMYGLDGLDAFKKTIRYARSKGLIVIGDIKRNDIASTAAAYSSAYLGRTKILDKTEKAFDMDFATVNPYFGSDGIIPFVEDCKTYNNGLFILVKTSNPSSGEIQDLVSDNKYIYEIVADRVSEWGNELIGRYGYSSIGAVVGATYPSQLADLRKRMPHTFFLVPGYGAQGGSAADIAGCFDNNGTGAVVNASRSILCAYKRDPWKGRYNETSFAEAARQEVIRMRDEINSALFF